MKTFRVLVLGVFCLGLTGLSAHAAGFRLIKDGTGVIKDAPDLMSDIVKNRLNAQRGTIEAQANQFLSQADLLARLTKRPALNGFTLYNVNFRLGQPTFRFTAVDAFEVIIRGNYLYAKSRTPGPLDSALDPAFQCDFDIRIVGTLSLPTVADPRFQVTSAVGSVTTLTVTARSVSAAPIVAILKTNAGRTFLTSIAQQYLTVDLRSQLNTWVGVINGPLRDLAAMAPPGVTPRVYAVLDAGRNVVDVHVDVRKVVHLGKKKVGP